MLNIASTHLPEVDSVGGKALLASRPASPAARSSHWPRPGARDAWPQSRINADGLMGMTFRRGWPGPEIMNGRAAPPVPGTTSQTCVRTQCSRAWQPPWSRKLTTAVLRPTRMPRSRLTFVYSASNRMSGAVRGGTADRSARRGTSPHAALTEAASTAWCLYAGRHPHAGPTAGASTCSGAPHAAI